jgi:cytochrome c peroxidase
VRTLLVAIAVAIVAACGTGDVSEPSLTPSTDSAPACVPGTIDPNSPLAAVPTLTSLHEECATNRAIVVRVQAGFCGPCQWSARHGHDLVDAVSPVQLTIVDVVTRDFDGQSVTGDTVSDWAKLQDVTARVIVDPEGHFVTKEHPLPRVLVVDPRTLAVRADLDDPSEEEVANAAQSVAAAQARQPLPSPRPITLVDGRFDRARWGMIREMAMSGPPPPDPTNAVADRPLAADLGKELFEDKLLSPTATVSCEKCHDATRAFTDGSETATGGIGGSTRNTPSVVTAAWSRWQLWDGRADSLWMQALGPIEDASEFGSTRLFVAHRVFDAYRAKYEALFGPMPPLDDSARFPLSGKPGDAAFDAMPQADRDEVTRVFVGVGKVVAAFERTFRVPETPLDAYALGDHSALDDAQKDELLAFFTSGCAQCHWGPRLTDDAFHNVRFPSGRDDFTSDPGRNPGITKYLASDFTGDGRWADTKAPRRSPREEPAMLGAFKTPPLRGSAQTPPWGHGGSVPFFTMAIDLHRTRGMPPESTLTTGTADDVLVSFPEANVEPLAAFLGLVRIGHIR